MMIQKLSLYDDKKVACVKQITLLTQNFDLNEIKIDEKNAKIFLFIKLNTCGWKT